jgi:hypothetical protein
MWRKCVLNSETYCMAFIVVYTTGYDLDGPGSNPGGGDIFCTCPDRPWVPPSLLYNGYRIFPGAEAQPERDADLSLPSSAVVKKV